VKRSGRDHPLTEIDERAASLRRAWTVLTALLQRNGAIEPNLVRLDGNAVAYQGTQSDPTVCAVSIGFGLKRRHVAVTFIPVPTFS